MEDVLAHDTRRRVFELVRKVPGAHLREIARVLDLSITLVDYHLRFLAKHGLVSFTMDGEYKRCYPRYAAGDAESKAALDDMDKRILGFLRQRVPRAVLLRLLEVEEAPHKDLLGVAGVSPSTLSHHLRKMVLAGLLESAASGYRIVDPLRVARLSVTYDIATPDQVEAFQRVWGEFRV